MHEERMGLLGSDIRKQLNHDGGLNTFLVMTPTLPLGSSDYQHIKVRLINGCVTSCGK